MLAVASIAAGCGSAGSAETGAAVSTSRLTKAEFVRAGEAICERGDKEIHRGAVAFKGKLGIGPKGSLTKAQEEELVEKVVVRSVRTQAKDLAKLGPPKGGLQEEVALVEGLEAVAEAGEDDPGKILVAAGPVARANKAATAYGVKECVQP
jgi:hypothetical protein